MESAQDKARFQPLTNQVRQTLTHLTTSLDGKCAANNILGKIAMVRQEVRDARGQRLGLARARRRQNL